MQPAESLRRGRLEMIIDIMDALPRPPTRVIQLANMSSIVGKQILVFLEKNGLIEVSWIHGDSVKPTAKGNLFMGHIKAAKTLLDPADQWTDD